MARAGRHPPQDLHLPVGPHAKRQSGRYSSYGINGQVYRHNYQWGGVGILRFPASITDGTSNTIFITEKLARSSYGNYVNNYCLDWSHCWSGDEGGIPPGRLHPQFQCTGIRQLRRRLGQHTTRAASTPVWAMVAFAQFPRASAVGRGGVRSPPPEGKFSGATGSPPCCPRWIPTSHRLPCGWGVRDAPAVLALLALPGCRCAGVAKEPSHMSDQRRSVRHCLLGCLVVSLTLLAVGCGGTSKGIVTGKVSTKGRCSREGR